MIYLSLLRPLSSPFTKENISKVPERYGVYLLMAEGGSEGDGIIYYVGAAGYDGAGRTLRNRLREHFRAQNREEYKKDSNSRFTNHTRKYGLHTASFLVLESYKKQPDFAELEARENYWISEFISSGQLLCNAGDSASPAKGVKLSEEQRLWYAQMRQAEWAAMDEDARKKRVRPMLNSRTSEEISQQTAESWQKKTNEEKKAWGNAISARMLAEPEEVRRERARKRFDSLPPSVRVKFVNMSEEDRVTYGLVSIARATLAEMQERGLKGAAARAAKMDTLSQEERDALNKKAWVTRLKNNPNAKAEEADRIRKRNLATTYEEYVARGKRGSETSGPEKRIERATRAAQTRKPRQAEYSRKAVASRRANLLATTGSDKIPGYTGPKNYTPEGRKRIGDANRRRSPEIIAAANAKRAGKRESKKLNGTDTGVIRFQELKKRVLATFPEKGMFRGEFVTYLKALGWSSRALRLLLEDGTMKSVDGFGGVRRYFLTSVDSEQFREDATVMPLLSKRAKITEEQARRVFQLYFDGMPKQRIGSEVGLSLPAVSRILNGKTYRKVYLELSLENRKRAAGTQTDLLIERVRETFPADGLTFGELVSFLKPLGYSEGVIPTLAKANVIVKTGNKMGKWVLHRAQKIIYC
jgi:hypothetical protein